MAPFRLGLTATLEREDGRQELLHGAAGEVVYRRGITELSGEYLAAVRRFLHSGLGAHVTAVFWECAFAGRLPLATRAHQPDSNRTHSAPPLPNKLAAGSSI